MTTARSALQEVGHKVAEPSADGLFGVVWERRGLSKRERRLITVQVLTALYRTGQFPNYVHRTLNAGSSKEENGVLIVDNTDYAGRPTADNTAQIIEQVFDGR